MKLVLITGASNGVGAATARRFVKYGARVLMVARSADKLEALAKDIGFGAIPMPCDAADPQAVAELADAVHRDHGVPEVIVHSAGAGAWKSVPDTSPAEAVEMMGAPYFAAFNITHAFLPAMLERNAGTIIHVNSPACVAAWPKSAGYTAARSALLGFHRALSQDLAGTEVKSCHVIFGEIETDYFETNGISTDEFPWLGKLIPTLTTDRCALVLTDLALHPRAYTVAPFLLRPHTGFATLFPRVAAWLLRF